MGTHQLHSLSPLDGRYSDKTGELAQYFSEAALIYFRISIEVDYLLLLSQNKVLRKFTPKEKKILGALKSENNQKLTEIKRIEKKTNHDVKAIEYYLRENLKKNFTK